MERFESREQPRGKFKRRSADVKTRRSFEDVTILQAKEGQEGRLQRGGRTHRSTKPPRNLKMGTTQKSQCLQTDIQAEGRGGKEKRRVIKEQKTT